MKAHALTLTLLLAVASGLLIWRTRLHLLWFLGAGAVLGWLQLV